MSEGGREMSMPMQDPREANARVQTEQETGQQVTRANAALQRIKVMATEAAEYDQYSLYVQMEEIVKVCKEALGD